MESRQLRRVLASNIRKQLQKKKMTANHLADFAGVSRSQLFDLLAGRKSVTIDWLAKLASALGVPPWELLAPGRGRQGYS